MQTAQSFDRKDPNAPAAGDTASSAASRLVSLFLRLLAALPPLPMLIWSKGLSTSLGISEDAIWSFVPFYVILMNLTLIYLRHQPAKRQFAADTFKFVIMGGLGIAILVVLVLLAGFVFFGPAYTIPIMLIAFTMALAIAFLLGNRMNKRLKAH